jgi:3-oxoacyl-[acyl-carrier protein] reductase
MPQQSDTRRFADKVVLVTGAQQGIGAATALAFGTEGATVLANWLDDEAAARRVAQGVEERGGRCALVRADVGDSAAVRRMFEDIEGSHGTVDVLVNNAGIFPRVSFLDMQEGQWDAVLGINLKGSILCAQAAARLMVKHGRGGAIVNVGSGAVRGQRLGVHYAASKAGLVGATRSMALELAPHGIRVNAVAPGLVDTAQPRIAHDDASLARMAAEIPLGRIGEGSDIADTILFLAGSGARFVTGQTLHVNGGTYLR